VENNYIAALIGLGFIWTGRAYIAQAYRQVKGMSNAEISGALYITESTVKYHAGNIFKKTGRSSRLELIADYKLGSGDSV
jgi:hypothetical protein